MKDETATFLKEQKQLKAEKAQEKKTQTINLTSYNEMKSIAKMLKAEDNYNKKHDIDNLMDFDFSNFNNPKLDGSAVANLIDENNYIIPATNLNVVFKNDETNIYYQDQDPYVDSSLVVSTVLDIMVKLISLGRHGIYMRVQKNNKLHDKVQHMEDEMDLQ